MLLHRAPRRPLLRMARLLVCLVALLAASLPPGLLRAAAPALTLNPDHGFCDDRVTAQGSGFPADSALVLQRGSDNGPVLARATADDAGTFAVSFTLICGESVAAGMTLTIVASPDKAAGGTATDPSRASATFTVQAVAGDAAWAAVRQGATPAGRPIYRPATLPARFRQTTPEFVDGTFLGVSYRNSAEDYLQFSIGGANSAAPTTAEPLAVHGQAGFLTFSDGSPPIGVNWQEAGQGYGIRGGTNITRAEILQVAEGLAPVGADGTFAPQCFAQTGKCATGRFLAYWLAHGGLALNGYPLGDELDQQLEDGNTYRVQYFERVRLELHPENPPPYDVLLGQFGRRFHSAEPPVARQSGATFFAETGHNVAPDLLAYWQAHGGLAQFGYPISEELTETLEDGKTYIVQYFERARFERHPENPSPDDILLGQFGRRILAEASR